MFDRLLAIVPIIPVWNWDRSVIIIIQLLRWEMLRLKKYFTTKYLLNTFSFIVYPIHTYTVLFLLKI